MYSHVGKYFHDRIIALIRFFFVNSISFQNTNINDRFVSSCSLLSFVLFVMVVFQGESFVIIIYQKCSAKRKDSNVFMFVI